MMYGIFKYNAYSSNKTARILFELEEIPNTDTVHEIQFTENLTDQTMNTLKEVFDYIQYKLKRHTYIIRRLVSQDVPDWIFKYLRINDVENPIYGKCLEIEHIPSGNKHEVFIVDGVTDRSDIHSGVFEASDDDSALLLMETSMN